MRAALFMAASAHSYKFRRREAVIETMEEQAFVLCPYCILLEGRAHEREKYLRKHRQLS